MKNENSLAEIFANTYSHIEKTADEILKLAERKVYNQYADKQKALIDEIDSIDLSSIESDRIEHLFTCTQLHWLKEEHKTIKDAWGRQLYRIGEEMKRRGYVISLTSEGFSFNWF